jgi:hypothetical protein
MCFQVCGMCMLVCCVCVVMCMCVCVCACACVFGHVCFDVADSQWFVMCVSMVVLNVWDIFVCLVFGQCLLASLFVHHPSMEVVKSFKLYEIFDITILKPISSKEVNPFTKEPCMLKNRDEEGNEGQGPKKAMKKAMVMQVNECHEEGKEGKDAMKKLRVSISAILLLCLMVRAV